VPIKGRQRRLHLCANILRPNKHGLGYRIGFTAMTLPQLKILQEAISLLVFVPFAVAYMKVDIKLDYLWAALCILGAVYFVFRSSGT
jgi:uncharacterized protein (DUF486 family)